MTPKAANTGAKRQTGNLNSWLKTSSRKDNQQKRPRSSSNAMDEHDASEKKQKPSPDVEGKPDPQKSAQKPRTRVSNGTAANTDKTTVTLTERTGDIFSAPPNTLIIHACNCQGSWGGGIALAFKKNYPESFKVYAKHCRENDANSLLGTALLTSPAVLNDATPLSGNVGAPRIGGKGGPTPQSRARKAKKVEEKHFIGCLFTSNFYGKRKDSPSKILSATGPAMQDLLNQVKDWNAAHDDEGEKVGAVRMCKINSGLFAVPWEDTMEVIEGIQVGESGVGEIEVVEREE